MGRPPERRDAFTDELDGLVDQWAATERELDGLEAFWKIGPLAPDKSKIADAHARANDIKAQINIVIGEYNMRGAHIPNAQ